MPAKKPSDEIVWLKEVEPFRDFEMVEGIEPLFIFRLRLEDAISQLRAIKDLLDDELIDRMKEEGIESFESGAEDKRVKIWYSKEKSEKISDTKRLEKMLFEGLVPNPDLPEAMRADAEARRDMARRALAGGQSAWKTPKVRELADTLGFEDLIKTTWKEKIKLSVVPKAILEGGK